MLQFFSSIFCSGRDEPPVATEPLIDVMEDGQYTGQQLENLIRIVREKLGSNIPAEEFKVCTQNLFLNFLTGDKCQVTYIYMYKLSPKVILLNL